MSTSKGPQLCLTWQDLDTNVTREYVGTPPVTLGRDHRNTLVFTHEQISRRHVQLEIVGEKIILLDLNSHNGAWVNKKRVEHAALESGDSFSIGPISFVVTIA